MISIMAHIIPYKSNLMTSIWRSYDKCTDMFKLLMKQDPAQIVEKYLEHHQGTIVSISGIIDTYYSAHTNRSYNELSHYVRSIQHGINELLKEAPITGRQAKEPKPIREPVTQTVRQLYTMLSRVYREYKILEILGLFYNYNEHGRGWISTITATGVKHIKCSITLNPISGSDWSPCSHQFGLRIKEGNPTYPCVVWGLPKIVTLTKPQVELYHEIVDIPFLMEDCLNEDGLIPTNPYGMFIVSPVKPTVNPVPAPDVDIFSQWAKIVSYKPENIPQEHIDKFAQSVAGKEICKSKFILQDLYWSGLHNIPSNVCDRIFEAYLKQSHLKSYLQDRDSLSFKEHADYLVYKCLHQIPINSISDMPSAEELLIIIKGAIEDGKERLPCGSYSYVIDDSDDRDDSLEPDGEDSFYRGRGRGRVSRGDIGPRQPPPLDFSSGHIPAFMEKLTFLSPAKKHAYIDEVIDDINPNTSCRKWKVCADVVIRDLELAKSMIKGVSGSEK